LPTRTDTRTPALALAILVVAGCAATETGRELPDISAWERRTAVLAALDEFEFAGRIGVQAAGDGFNGRFRWEQDESRFDASISGPLGIGTVLIQGDGRHVVVTDNDGETVEMHDVESELYYRYGWTIPVSSLRFWALGIPDPDMPATTEFGAAGELVRLDQAGWSVEISRYREVAGGQQMPGRLTAKNPRTSVRLVIDRWTFHERPDA